MTAPVNKFKELFCLDVGDNLNALSQEILEIEKNPHDQGRYHELMRHAHTIKGSAATMGYVRMANLAHALEDLFHANEDGTPPFSSESVTIILHAVDAMADSLSSIKNTDHELDVDELQKALQKLLAGDVAGARNDVEIFRQHAETMAKDVQNGHDASLPHEQKLNTLGQVRVSIERLDTLMGLFEEMLLLRLKLNTLLELDLEVIQSLNHPLIKQRTQFVYEYKNLFNEMARLLSETQEVLLAARLVPLEQIFIQFPRMVRDLSLREEKKISFHVEGGDIELDRTVLDGLSGALTHLLRNAIDHGIVREGTITLRATREKNRIHVVVADDGGGIDYARVRTTAIERGVIERTVAETMSNKDLAELLFHARMSTKAEVTDVSGRGVGLSSVKAFTEDVGGHLSVISPIYGMKGGTRFLLDLPISLATVKVLLVESRGYTFAIPFDAIIRTVSLRNGDIVSAAQQETFLCDGKITALFLLERMPGSTFAMPLLGGNDNNKDKIAVLLSRDYGASAILVDDCAGEKELLVKSLPPILRGIKGFSGSALLPDGRTILVLDIHGLITQALLDAHSQGVEES